MRALKLVPLFLLCGWSQVRYPCMDRNGDTMAGDIAMGGNSITGALNVTATGTVQAATVTATGAVNGASAAITGNSTVQQVAPSANNTYSSATSSNRWSNVYGVLGNFSGLLTSTVASGSDAINLTQGARLHWSGAGLDYASSDGTTITFAGPVATQALNATTLSLTGLLTSTIADGNNAIKMGSGTVKSALSESSTGILDIVNNGSYASGALSQPDSTKGTPFCAYVPGATTASNIVCGEVAAGVGAEVDALTISNVGIAVVGSGTFSTGVGIGGGTTITKSASASVSITPAAMNAAVCTDATATVTGVVSGSLCMIAPPSALGDISVQAYGSGSNTVTLHWCNPHSVTAVTPPAGAYIFRCFTN